MCEIKNFHFILIVKLEYLVKIVKIVLTGKVTKGAENKEVATLALDNNEKTWQKLQIGENNLHYRKFLIQAAKKRTYPTKSSRVGRGVCLIEIFCDIIELAQVQSEATTKLREKQEKWRNRGLLPPEDATWQRLVVEAERKEFRDLVVKRARSKRFRARTGSVGENLFVEVLCHLEQMEQLQESAEEILREREWDSNLDNPNYSLYKKMSANPLKSDDEVQEEQIVFLRSMVGDLRQAVELFKQDPDEHYYDLNLAGKNLYREIYNLTNEGKTVIFTLPRGIKKYIRWVGDRYKMTWFKTSGERYPTSIGILSNDAINLIEVIDIVI